MKKRVYKRFYLFFNVYYIYDIIISCCWALVFISNHIFFEIPDPIFAKLCHTTQYVLKLITSYMGVYMCPLKIWRAKTLNFRRFANPKSTLWTPTFPNAGKIEKSKTIVSICGCCWARTSIHTEQVWAPPPNSEICCSLTYLLTLHGASGGAHKLWIESI